MGYFCLLNRPFGFDSRLGDGIPGNVPVRPGPRGLRNAVVVKLASRDVANVEAAGSSPAYRTVRA
jgi:hypothetical protein